MQWTQNTSDEKKAPLKIQRAKKTSDKKIDTQKNTRAKKGPPMK
jgi:hypothetical protein